jgi:hypothetical protein
MATYSPFGKTCPRTLVHLIFSAIDSYTWERITSWLRKKHRLIGWPEFRRRYCLPGTWWLAHDGVRLKGAASVPVVLPSRLPLPDPVDPVDRRTLTNTPHVENPVR